MIFSLLVHLVSFLIVGGAISRLMILWAKKENSSAYFLMFTSCFLLIIGNFWLLLPIYNPLPPKINILVYGWLRTFEFYFGWTFLFFLFCFCIGVAITRLWWGYRTFYKLKSEQFTAENQEDYISLIDKTIFLEDTYRNIIKSPRFKIRFTGQTELAILKGIIFPTIYTPMSLLASHSSIDENHLELLLDQKIAIIKSKFHVLYSIVAFFIRIMPIYTPLLRILGSSILTILDRRLVKETTWNTHKNTLLVAVADRDELSPALALGHRAGDIKLRIIQAECKSSNTWHLYLILALLLIGLSVSTCLGKISPFAIKSFLMRETIPGCVFRIFDPLTRVSALSGKGGAIQDGMKIDASKVKEEISSVQIKLHRAVVGMKAARISFDWRADHVKGNKDAPVAGVRVCELLTTQNKLLFHVYEMRSKILKNGSGHECFDIKLTPPEILLLGSKPYIAGPDFAVAPGWILYLTNFKVESIDPKIVPPTKFPDVAIEFTEWYNRLSPGKKINLSWR